MRRGRKPTDLIQFTPYADAAGHLATDNHLDDGRVRLRITRADMDRFHHEATVGRGVVVHDHTTGLDWYTEPADCGAACTCAATARLVTNDGDGTGDRIVTVEDVR